MLQPIICSGASCSAARLLMVLTCPMQTLRSILRNNGLASSPQKECVQLLVSGSISVAMHQFLTTSSLGKPVLPDSCLLCHVWLLLQAHASCPDLRPILLNAWQEVIVLSRTSTWASRPGPTLLWHLAMVAPSAPQMQALH